jgi:hypothetical protein
MKLENSTVGRSDPQRPPKRFRRWMTVVSLIVAVGVMVFIALVLQDRNDQLLADQMIQSEAELRATGARIADIQDHEFKTMPDYVKTYAQVEPLLRDYDRESQEYSDLCNRAQRRDQTRWLIDFRRHRYDPEVWRKASEIVELVRQINAVMKKEASVIRDMSALPGPEQAQFRHENFAPLLAQEHALREQLLLAAQKRFSGRTI